MSKRKTRILDAEAYLLTAYDWSETSLIAHVFSKDHGIICSEGKIN